MSKSPRASRPARPELVTAPIDLTGVEEEKEEEPDGYDEAETQELFKKCDKDNSGHINPEEFKTTMRELAPAITDGQLLQGLLELDVDGNGQITWDGERAFCRRAAARPRAARGATRAGCLARSRLTDFAVFCCLRVSGLVEEAVLATAGGDCRPLPKVGLRLRQHARTRRNPHNSLISRDMSEEIVLKMMDFILKMMISH